MIHVLAYNALHCATNNAYAYSQQWLSFPQASEPFQADDSKVGAQCYSEQRFGGYLFSSKLLRDGLNFGKS
jgi:hypothetical protein